MTSCPTGVNLCGVCCDPVVLAWNPVDLVKRMGSDLDGLPDPETDEGWAVWESKGHLPRYREKWVNAYHNQPDSRANARFIEQYWSVRSTTQNDQGDTVRWDMTCVKFNPHDRTCGAYDDRPPICSGFPFYGAEPSADRNVMDKVCAYHDDIPGRKVLPLVGVSEAGEVRW